MHQMSTYHRPVVAPHQPLQQQLQQHHRQMTVGTSAGNLPGGFDQIRLSSILNMWLTTDVNHARQDTYRRRVGDGVSEDPAVRGPFYAPLFLRHKTLSTPPLVQQMRAQCKVGWQMKIFPHLLRAAAIIDERVFLWNYETGRDPVLFEASSNITAIDIVKPVPGVFEPHVHFLLVVASFSAVELVALHIRDPHRNEICLQKLPDFQVTNGKTVVQCICSFVGRTSECPPRVFLGCNDGCVYELKYRAHDGWLRNRMYIENISVFGGTIPVVSSLVYGLRESLSGFRSYAGIKDLQTDCTRNYLYALDAKGTVYLWFLGPDAEATVAQFQCSTKVSTGSADAVSIHPVPKQRATDHEILYVLLDDGSRVLYSATSSQDQVKYLQAPRMASDSDLSTCPLKVVSQLQIRSVEAGPLCPSLPLEQLGSLGPVDSGPGRNLVSPKVSVLIPKAHQEHPHLICTTSLSLNGGSYSSALTVVDLQPLISQVDTWRRGELPTTGVNIFSVVEEEWGAGVVDQLYASASDLTTQIIRPSPRYLVVHSAGITLLTRLRPADLLHISLLHPSDSMRQGLRERLAGIGTGIGITTGLGAGMGMNAGVMGGMGVGGFTSPELDEKQLDLNWLVMAYGKLEVAVMLLTLICSDLQTRPHGFNGMDSGAAIEFSMTGGPLEESVAHALSCKPSQDVVQRAQEQFIRMGPAGHAALFQYFARIVSPLWTTSFQALFWEQMWQRRQFHLFLKPLEGLARYLGQLTPPNVADLQHVWNPHTDAMAPGSAVLAFMQENDSFASIYDLLCQPMHTASLKPDHETLKTIEGLSRRGLYAIVERTVEALRILAALEDLLPEERAGVSVKIRSMELGRVVVGLSLDETEPFADALMGELLQLPHAVDKVWNVWRQCRTFFDPAAVDFYEARQRIVSRQSASNINLIKQALSRLEHPEVAPCLLRRQAGQFSGSVRLETICADLRRAKHYFSAMHLAMVAAKHCDPENRAEFWHVATAEPEMVQGDISVRAEVDNAAVFFQARRTAYNEIISTLDLLCGNDYSHMDLDSVEADSVKSQRAAAIEWAFGPAAAKYYDSQQKSLARPVLAGELFKCPDKLLHYHLYAWIVSTPDGDGVWPSRGDLARVRPARLSQHNTSHGDSLQQFLSAGKFGSILSAPRNIWMPHMLEPWVNTWELWHIGLLNDLADYCESQDSGCYASCVRLTLSSAHSSLLHESPDYCRLQGKFLKARIEVLIKAEASAQRDSTTLGKQLDQWLRSQKPSAVAGVQLEMLQELPHEAWDRAKTPEQEECARKDEQELASELLSAPKLYEMLHDSYDEAVPHLAIKLLRIMGIERPELKHIFPTQSNIGPWKVSDFVIKVLSMHHREDLRSESLQICFKKLQDAAGVDQGIVHHVESPFLPLQLVLSGLEEMAMVLKERTGGSFIPTGSLCHPAATPVSIVPRVVAPALGWPSSRLLYDGYRQLWIKVDRSQTHDLYPGYRGCQVDNMKERRAVVARLMGILGQFCLQWLDRHEPDLAHPPSGLGFQRLNREYPVFADDLEQMAIAAENYPDIPHNVRDLIINCRQRLKQFSQQIQAVQPTGTRREW